MNFILNRENIIYYLYYNWGSYFNLIFEKKIIINVIIFLPTAVFIKLNFSL